MRTPFTFLAAALMAGCASAPPPKLSASHPASPEAAEGRRLARVTSLGADDLTRKTNELLAAARKEQERWNAAGSARENGPEFPAPNIQTPNPHEHP